MCSQYEVLKFFNICFQGSKPTADEIWKYSKNLMQIFLFKGEKRHGTYSNILDRRF